MPRISNKAKATLAEIAKRNNITTEKVIAHIDRLLHNRKVSKHFSILTRSV